MLFLFDLHFPNSCPVVFQTFECPLAKNIKKKYEGGETGSTTGIVLKPLKTITAHFDTQIFDVTCFLTPQNFLVSDYRISFFRI